MNCFNSFSSQIAIKQNKNKPWSELGLGVSGGATPVVYAIHVLDLSNVFVGGNFTSVGDISVNRIAKWNAHSGSWSPLGTGCIGASTPPVVYAIHATSASNIYVGGTFAMAGNVSNTNRIARWNSLTNTWSALSGGSSGTGVYAIHSSGTDVYVGGAFTTVINGSTLVSASNIARWSGSAWSALDAGVGNDVYTIYAHSSGVYVGGYFTGAASSISGSRIARWSGSSWTTLNGGCNSQVNAIYVIDANNIFVGGNFTTVGNPAIPVNYIAKWNNNTNRWSALGSGCNNYVQTIHALDSNNIFVGGNFNGDLSMNYIAKWNNNTTEWSALGSGCNNYVQTIYALDSRNVFVGGNFTTAGGITVNRIAKWDNGS